MRKAITDYLRRKAALIEVQTVLLVPEPPRPPMLERLFGDLVGRCYSQRELEVAVSMRQLADTLMGGATEFLSEQEWIQAARNRGIVRDLADGNMVICRPTVAQ